MKKARMNISHSRFILFKLKIFGEIVTTIFKPKIWNSNPAPNPDLYKKLKSSSSSGGGKVKGSRTPTPLRIRGHLCYPVLLYRRDGVVHKQFLFANYTAPLNSICIPHSVLKLQNFAWGDAFAALTNFTKSLAEMKYFRRRNWMKTIKKVFAGNCSHFSSKSGGDQ